MILKTFINFLIGLQICLAQSSQNPIPLVLSNEELKLEYDDFLISNPNYTSLSQFYESQTPIEADREILLNLFELAQKQLVLNNPLLAKNKFNEIIKLSRQVDWDSSMQEIIFYSFIRRAIMSSDSNEQKRFLLEAYRFSPDSKINFQLSNKQDLNDSLLNEYESLSKLPEEEAQTWSPDWDSSIHFIYINGLKYTFSHNLKIKLTNSKNRLSVFTNTHYPYSGIHSREEIKKFKGPLIKIASGTCEKPIFPTEPPQGLNKIALFYNKNCIYEFKENLWELKNNITNNFKPSPSQSEFFASLNQNKIADHQEKGFSILKSPWFWIAVGGIAIGAAVSINSSNKQNEEKQVVKPSHH